VKSTRIYWTAGALLAAGVVLLAVAVTVGPPSFVTTAQADGDHPKHSPTPKHSATPKHSPTPQDTATPQDTSTPDQTETPSPSPTNTAEPTPTSTEEPPPPPDTPTPDPTLTLTTSPPTATPTLVAQELGITQIPNAGDGGLLAQHREGIAVLGILLIGLAVVLIAARGAADARQV